MYSTVQIALLATAYLMAKHMLADFVLQTPYQIRNKGTYLHPGGILHAGIHSALSLPVYAIVRADLRVTILLTLAEFLVHYHVDWTKEQVNRCGQLTQSDATYWWTFGTDQLMHSLTYLAMVWLLMRPFDATYFAFS